MANAAFFVNDIKVKKKGQYLLVEARKKCGHGTVFNEVFLTLPVQLEHLFNQVESNNHKKPLDEQSSDSQSLTELFKRFSSEN